MKIGILTQPLRNNYGAILQNYALQEVLRRNGHCPITLDWEEEGFPLWKRMSYPIAFFLLRIVFGKGKYPKFHYQPSKREARIISSKTNEFISKYIVRKHILEKCDSLCTSDSKLGIKAFVVGSDQVWRPKYNDGHLDDMYLSFTQGMDVKRIAYAASFGTDKWEYSQKQTDACKQLVNRFNLITVREDSAVKLCVEQFGVNSYHVLDPTMLLTRDDYEHIIFQSNTSKSPGNLFYYILDPNEEKLLFIKKISKHLDLSPFTVLPKYQKETLTYSAVKNKTEDCIYPSVESWLRAYVDSEMIICDSFHGCVFSIIFNKPFWVLKNSNRGNARFESLLRLFGLEDRLIDLHMISTIDINKTIEWTNINKALLKKSTYSQELLLASLC